MNTWKELSHKYPDYLVATKIVAVSRRLSALVAIEIFIQGSYPELFNGKKSLTDFQKNDLRNSYNRWKGKDLSGAERQVFNDLYKMLKLEG